MSTFRQNDEVRQNVEISNFDLSTKWWISVNYRNVIMSHFDKSKKWWSSVKFRNIEFRHFDKFKKYPKPMIIQTWNFLNILFWVRSYAHGCFHSLKIYIYGVMGLYLVKNRIFRPEKFVSRVAPKTFVIHTWNFMDIFFRVWTYTPVYFHPPKLNIYGVLNTLFVIEQLLVTRKCSIAYSGFKFRLIQGRIFASLSKWYIDSYLKLNPLGISHVPVKVVKLHKLHWHHH